MGSSWWQNPPSLVVSLLNHLLSKGGALAPLVVSTNFAHLRVWAGETFLWIIAVFWCGSHELLGCPGLAGGFISSGLCR